MTGLRSWSVRTTAGGRCRKPAAFSISYSAFMLQKIIAASIHNKLLVFLLVAALVGWGSYSALHLPLDAIPDVTNNQVQVITQSPALKKVV